MYAGVSLSFYQNLVILQPQFSPFSFCFQTLMPFLAADFIRVSVKEKLILFLCLGE